MTSTWTGETRMGPAVVVGPAIAGLVLCVIGVAAVLQRQWQMMAVVVIIMAALGLAFSMLKCRVSVDTRGIRARSGPITWLKVPLEQIDSAVVDHVEPLGDFGGWGIRFGRRGLGLVTSRGDAVWVQRADGRQVCLTVTDPASCAAAITSLVTRREGHA